jgi:threonine dehydrogenase-like Zn-dependent dehydrogenase
VDVTEALREMTGARGPDSCVDAVGMEGHGLTIGALYDRAKQALRLETDRPNTLRQAIMACRKGGTISIAGAYGGLIDKFPIGAVFAKSLTIRSGQTHVHRYMKPLLKRVEDGDIDPSCVITHRLDLADADRGYRMFQKKEDQCIKVVMTP